MFLQCLLINISLFSSQDVTFERTVVVLESAVCLYRERNIFVVVREC